VQSSLGNLERGMLAGGRSTETREGGNNGNGVITQEIRIGTAMDLKKIRGEEKCPVKKQEKHDGYLGGLREEGDSSAPKSRNIFGEGRKGNSTRHRVREERNEQQVTANLKNSGEVIHGEKVPGVEGTTKRRAAASWSRSGKKRKPRTDGRRFGARKRYRMKLVKHGPTCPNTAKRGGQQICS